MLAHLQRLAGYNQWANHRLYAAAAALDEAEYFADRGAFIGSVHGALSHILVADRIWLWRITGEGETYDRHDVQPYETLAALQEARTIEDKRLIDFVSRQDLNSISTATSYGTMDGEARINPLRTILGHVFNHQTHHRAQAHMMLAQLGCEVPSLDLIRFVWEQN